MGISGVVTRAVLAAVVVIGMLAPAGAGAAQGPQSLESPPAAPTHLEVWSVRDGVATRWQGVSGAASYQLERRDDAGSSWTVIGEVIPPERFTDDSLAPGASAQYAVRAVGPGGRGEASAPVAHTRTAVDAVVGSVDVIAFAPGAPAMESFLADPAQPGTWEDRIDLGNLGMSLVASTRGSPTGSVTLPHVDGPGTYELGPGADAWYFRFQRDRNCEAASGELIVHDIAYDLDRQPEVYSADYRIVCEHDGAPAIGTIRWRSTRPYRAAASRVSGPTEPHRPVGTSELRTVTFTNGRQLPLQLGSLSTVPAVDHRSGQPLPGSGDWTVTPGGDGCSGVGLEPGGQCNVEVRFAPSARDARTAVLQAPVLNPEEGASPPPLTVGLRGEGIERPAAPSIVSVEPTVGRVRLDLEHGDEGNGDVDALIVRRRAQGTTAWSSPIVVAYGLSSHPALAWTDPAVVPGTTYDYDVRARNQAGESATGALTTAAGARQDLVFTMRSDRGRLAAQRPGVVDRWPVVWSGPHEIHTPAAAPGGERIVYARRTGDGLDLYTERSWGGAPVRLTSLSGDERDPVWSPDGRTIAFTRTNGTATSVWTVPAGGGTPVKRAEALDQPTWLPDSRTLIAADTTSTLAALVQVDDARRRTILTGSEGARRPQVSPDGRRLAYLDAGGDQVIVRTLAGTPAEASFHAPTIRHQLLRWSADGREVVTTALDSEVGRSQLVRTYRVGTSPLAVTLRASYRPPEPFEDLALRTVGVRLESPPTTTSGSPRLGFTVPGAPSGTTTRCRLDSGSWQACLSPWRPTGVSAGEHLFTVEASQPGGPTSVTAHRFVADTTPPVVAVTAPTKRTTLTDRIETTYQGRDPAGIASFDVRHRRARYDATFAAYTYPTSWQATTATTQRLGLSRGHDTCISVRARDRVGNRSAWSPERCTARPLDDRSLRASSGWTRGTGSAFLEGTITSTTRKGVELSLPSVQAKQVTVIATRCPTCGTAEVFVGTTRVGRLDLTASSTRRQQVIALPVQTNVRSGKLTIRTTSTGRTVAIDGVAVRRS
jgi:hypothetical protein